tara:strand:- start:345 stop:644 length:300 start_codon:yes stop_codon:yes gene_type:complete
MAQTIEEIKAGLPPVGNSIVNGVEVELSEEEKEATLNTWAENERARQLDEEANGYKTARQAQYPSIEDCIHALLDGGDTLTDLQAARQAVKDAYPKPGE